MSEKAKHRAVWTLTNEQVLLDLFEKAREDPASRKGRGIKPDAWASIALEINRLCSGSFNVDQLKSKYVRISMDYELFREVGGEGSLSGQDWDEIIQARPDNASRLRQFKESGFPHTDVCRRIAVTKEDGNSRQKAKVVTAKRVTRSDIDVPKPKRACIEVTRGNTEWDLSKEKLLLFLCWKAKSEHDVPADDMVAQGWVDLTTEFNEYCTTNFTEKEVKEKYVKLMQNYNLFKIATGYSGSADAIPKNDMDWECLIRERPRYYLQLEKLKEESGFPHAEVCSLIKGDTPSNGMGPTNLSEFLSTGLLQPPRPSNTASRGQSSAHAIASAQASLSASALSYLLPATATSVMPPAINGRQGPSGPAGGIETAAGAAGSPAVFSQELHDNLNMFLKTATAYLVMLINEHSQEREL